jgi:hypothetical protein
MPRTYSRSIRSIREPRPIGDGLCELELTLGFVAIIDEIDAARVAVCSWCASHNQSKYGPYAKGRPTKGGPFVRLHRFILGFPDSLVDHANGNRMDNRRANLRLATHRDNNANRNAWSSSASGFKGVTIDRDCFIATCDSVRLGTFATARAAALAYDAEAIRRFGSFARTNAALGLLTTAAEAN